MGSNSSLGDLLECPVCMTFMNPPIYQCCNGHTICFTCKTKVSNSCPICRKELGNIRCIALEKLAERLDLPCKFHVFGCININTCVDRLKHEQICSFRPYNCPYHMTECSITGDIKIVVSHLEKDHHAIIIDLVDESTFKEDHSVCLFVRTMPRWFPKIISSFSDHFYMHFEVFDVGKTPVFMACLRFMGDESDAKSFRYCLKIEGKERTVTWQGIPRSIRESVETVRDSLDGLIIPNKNLLLFRSSARNRLRLSLEVQCRIWKGEAF